MSLAMGDMEEEAATDTISSSLHPPPSDVYDDDDDEEEEEVGSVNISNLYLYIFSSSYLLNFDRIYIQKLCSRLIVCNKEKSSEVYKCVSIVLLCRRRRWSLG